ncbi:MAG: hypothetical protein JNM82_16005 [Rhodocyclaceae bacterium]|nr:hypothetical protein [Rhodocyclaceae bacterium]
MTTRTNFPLADEILAAHAQALGADFDAYRNHVCRMLHFFVALAGGNEAPPDHVQVAAAFHDLGIWTAHTFDYLPPSVALADAWLAGRGMESLAPEVAAIVTEHHKLRPWRGPWEATVETFRRADLVDLSLGAIRFGLPAAQVRAVRTAFPNAGFHRLLARLTVRQFLRTPLRPLPMFRW